MNITACNVTVMVAQMDRAIRFYTEVLGFKLAQRFGDHWAQVEGPGITIGLHPTENMPEAGGGLSIALGVDNVDQAIADLKGKDASLAFNVVPDGYVKLAHFADPDGNALYLVEETEH